MSTKLIEIYTVYSETSCTSRKDVDFSLHPISSFSSFDDPYLPSGSTILSYYSLFSSRIKFYLSLPFPLPYAFLISLTRCNIYLQHSPVVRRFVHFTSDIFIYIYHSLSFSLFYFLPSHKLIVTYTVQLSPLRFS